MRRAAAAQPTILFVTPSLGVGGAEIFLLRLCEALQTKVNVCVLAFGINTSLEEQFRSSGVSVFSFEARGPRSIVVFSYQALRLIRRLKPDVIQGWLYGGDVLAALFGAISGHRRIFGSIRNTFLPLQRTRFQRVTRCFARFANKHAMKGTIACDEQARMLHVEAGYPDDQTLVISNMVPSWQADMNEESRLLKEEIINELDIFLAARFEEGKGHLELVLAALQLRVQGIAVRVHFAGLGCERGGRLQNQVERITNDTKDVFFFYGVLSGQAIREKLLRLDLYVMPSSLWEAFPNALLEAVTVGMPALATPLGSAEAMVGPVRTIACPDAKCIAESVKRICAETVLMRTKEAQRASQRVRELYSRENIVSQYLTVWEVSTTSSFD